MNGPTIGTHGASLKRRFAELFVIVLLAAIPRVLVAWAFSGRPAALSDADYYDATARSLAAGHGYVVHLTERGFFAGGEPTAFFLPGYSHVLAILYRVFGASTDVASALNVVCGVMSVCLLFAVTSRAFPRPIAYATAAVAALHPAAIFWTPVLLSETLFGCLILAGCVLAMRVPQENGGLRVRPLVGLSLLAGCAMLVRAQGILLLPVFFAAWFSTGAIDRRAVVRGLLIAVPVAALLPLGWAFRNYQAMNVVGLTTSLGYNLRVGHAPYSTGRFIDPIELRDERLASLRDIEVHQDREGRARTIDFVTTHPLQELDLGVRKVYWLWAPSTDVTQWLTAFGPRPLPRTSERLIKGLILVTHLGVLATAVIGLAQNRRNELAAFTLWSIIAWTLFHVVFFGEPRFVLPIVPLLLPFSVMGCATLLATPAAIFQRLRSPIPE